MLITTMAGPFPVKNATAPYWRTQLHHLDSHRSTPELPEKQDIVIIGAGFAGAALAHYLLKDSPENEPKPSITILEAREACSGATARNGESCHTIPIDSYHFDLRSYASGTY